VSKWGIVWDIEDRVEKGYGKGMGKVWKGYRK